MAIAGGMEIVRVSGVRMAIRSLRVTCCDLSIAVFVFEEAILKKQKRPQPRRKAAESKPRSRTARTRRGRRARVSPEDKRLIILAALMAVVTALLVTGVVDGRQALAALEHLAWLGGLSRPR